jgi:hypothetical protein
MTLTPKKMHNKEESIVKRQRHGLPWVIFLEKGKLNNPEASIIPAIEPAPKMSR